VAVVRAAAAPQANDRVRFGKLLPREGNFFEMFNQHAERIVEGAHAFSKLVANYNDTNLREQYTARSTAPSAPPTR
jgi:hypothetical protein